MMAQYRRIKSELPKDAFAVPPRRFLKCSSRTPRKGDVDQPRALTARNGIPMCGLPFHAANNYISRLLKAWS